MAKWEFIRFTRVSLQPEQRKKATFPDKLGYSQ